MSKPTGSVSFGYDRAEIPANQASTFGPYKHCFTKEVQNAYLRYPISLNEVPYFQAVTS